MNILLVGNGGREHALAWKLAQSPQVETVYVAPGNGGTATEPGLENIAIGATDIPALLEFARTNGVGLTVIGPEAPLVAGIVDAFKEAGLPCFGPCQAAARLEGSKAYSKAFMDRHDIPTAAHATFTDCDQALAFLRDRGVPIVVKADGLAAGKGVIVAHDMATAENAVRDMLSGNVFGEAGHRVIIEDFLEGEEASFIVMADGTHALAMATSQDHKARDEGDTGPNTGGMGAYSPAPVVTTDIHTRVMDEVIMPVLKGMTAEGHPYTGFLYAGLMISSKGDLKVLEFNCRFGDPETQPIMMRLQSDLVELCLAALDGRLDQVEAKWDPRPSIGVVLASAGYPGDYEKGLPISGLDNDDGTTKVFHAGTRLVDGRTVTDGGRVLCVCSLGDDLIEARKRVYDRIADIRWDGMFYRSDIAHRAIDRSNK
ncbi:MAG: phosphoribosylamine--glycine ligase [Gammaproteobacteria bacterium]|nr:phosphoribosylamine--glycine ligase [Gammaproteobacteria bacterium]